MLVTTRGIQIIWGGGVGGWEAGIRLGIVLIARGAQSLFSKTLLSFNILKFSKEGLGRVGLLLFFRSTQEHDFQRKSFNLLRVKLLHETT